MKLVIFDFDGTLVYLKVNYEGMREELKRYFEKYGIRSEFKPLIPSVNRAILRVEKKTGKKITKEVFEILDRFEMECVEKSLIFPGSSETLRKLKFKGYKIAIFSNNGEKCINTILERMKVRNIVDSIFSRDRVKDGINVKPSEEGILEIMKTLGVKKEETWMVGDRIYDEIAARSAGIRFVGIKTPYSECDFQNPDFIIKAPEELLKIIP